MIWVTGDTHSTHDIRKVVNFSKGAGKDLTKNDFLIITGDFGVLWEARKNKEENALINGYNNFSFTTLFIDGNHENHERLEQLPTEEKFGSDVGVVSESIFHLRRGKIYEIDGKKIWTMGGGFSIDKALRQEFISWWSQELPNWKEMTDGVETLEKVGKEVDYIITHCPPREVFKTMMNKFDLKYKDTREEMEFQEYLQDVAHSVKFKKWFFGHLHEDLEIDKNFISLYNIVRDLDGRVA